MITDVAIEYHRFEGRLRPLGRGNDRLGAIYPLRPLPARTQSACRLRSAAPPGAADPRLAGPSMAGVANIGQLGRRDFCHTEPWQQKRFRHILRTSGENVEPLNCGWPRKRRASSTCAMATIAL